MWRNASSEVKSEQWSDLICLPYEVPLSLFKVQERAVPFGQRRSTMSRYRNSEPISRHFLQTRTMFFLVRVVLFHKESGPASRDGSAKKGAAVAKDIIIRKSSGGICVCLDGAVCDS